MTDYVVGFAFSQDGRQVVLLRKNRPDWQAGKLNGVGGKLEAGETALAAMVREFVEETGVETQEADWREYAMMQLDQGGKVFFFKYFDHLVTEQVQSLTDEEVGVYRTEWAALEGQAIGNLRWLITAALDLEENPYLTISYVQSDPSGGTA